MIFKYKAYQELLRELGRADYVAELVEVATRQFIKEIEESNDPKKFVEEKSKEHGIRFSFDNTNDYQIQIALSHIAGVYHITENFFYAFQTEYNSLSQTDWHFKPGQTKLQQIIDFISSHKSQYSQNDIDAYLIDTFNYYHTLRVYFSHKRSTKPTDIVASHGKAKAHFNDNIMNEYKIKSAPNTLESLTFEDFFLFTQVSKKLALQISSVCVPSPESFARQRDIIKLKRHENRADRIEMYLKSEYGFVKQTDFDDICVQIANEL